MKDNTRDGLFLKLLYFTIWTPNNLGITRDEMQEAWGEMERLARIGALVEAMPTLTCLSHLSGRTHLGPWRFSDLSGDETQSIDGKTPYMVLTTEINEQTIVEENYEISSLSDLGGGLVDPGAGG